MGRSRLIGTVAALGAALALPSIGLGVTQPVSATSANLLGLGVATPVVLTPLTPGQTSTGSGTLAVTANLLEPWTISIQDVGPSSAPGNLVRTSGSGPASLGAPLSWSTVIPLGTNGSGTLTGAAQVAGSGVGPSAAVVTNYSQPVGAGEIMSAGAAYGLTVTWTVSPT